MRVFESTHNSTAINLKNIGTAGLSDCWANVLVQASQLAIEQEPAHLIAQPLVIKHKCTDLFWKLCTLPLAL